jgi:hypothetical protein
VALAAVAHALDRVRSPLLRVLLSRSSWLRGIARSRERRLVAIGLTSLGIALFLSVGFTTGLFLWAPLLLGVPHIAADFRYLLLDPYRPAPLRVRDGAVALLLVACVVWQAPTLGWMAVLASQILLPLHGLSLTRRLLRAASICGIGVVCCLAYQFPVGSSYLLLHAHNAIAIIFFTAMFSRRREHPASFTTKWTVPTAIGLAALLIMTGAFDATLQHAPVESVAQYVLPTSSTATWSPIVCARIVALFVFMQSMHYAIWLRLIPELLRPRAGMRSFDASLRSLRQDIGSLAVVATVAMAALFIVFGLVNTSVARDWYLRLAGFHAYLEIAVLIRWMRF